MQIEYKAPGPDEILAVQYRARQMQAETIAAGARALGRALRSLAQRVAALGARSAGA
jgi:hypothetical protein